MTYEAEEFDDQPVVWPELDEGVELERRHRVVRMAFFHGVITAFCLSLFLLASYMLASGDTGFVIMFVLFGFFGFVFGYWFRSYARDLSARPLVIEGDIQRKWHKGNVLIFFLPSYYLAIQGRIFSVDRREYAMLLEEDLVRVCCYPHSLTVERLERYDSTEKKFIPATDGATF